MGAQRRQRCPRRPPPPLTPTKHLLARASSPTHPSPHFMRGCPPRTRTHLSFIVSTVFFLFLSRFTHTKQGSSLSLNKKPSLYPSTTRPTLGYLKSNLAFHSRRLSSSRGARPERSELQSDTSVDTSANARAHSRPANG